LGRFISRDPLSGAEFSQGTNLYCYCRNNYLNASDPTGRCLSLNGNYGQPNPYDQALSSPSDSSIIAQSFMYYFTSQTGSAGLDTDGSGQAALGEGTMHDTGTSGGSLNGDTTPYAAQNQNANGGYTYPIGTQVVVVNNDTGASAVGIVGDNATPNNTTPNNEDEGRSEVSTGMGNDLGVTQYNGNGQLLNSTNDASITTYFIPKH